MKKCSCQIPSDASIDEEPVNGIEPLTPRLQGGRSAAELHRRDDR